MGRTEKSLKNIAFGLIAQLLTTIASFATRTFMLRCLDIDSISLNALFTEIVSTLSLAELGIGSVVVYNLYKPLAENDLDRVSQLMFFLKKVYRIIALVTFVIGSFVCIFVPLMITDLNLPNSYMRFIYMLFVAQISISYLCTYKLSLLNADQNNYILSIVTSIGKIITSFALIGVLLLFKNFTYYLIVNIIFTLLTNIAASKIVDYKYPYLKDIDLPKEDQKEVFRDIKNIFIKQVSGKITNSTDNILISTMVSTILVGYYSFYSLVLSVFKQLTDKIDEGIKASIGNLYAVGNNDECELSLNRLTWLYSVLGIVISTDIYLCMEPFIKLWVGEKYILSHHILWIICINMFFYIACKPIYSVMHISGYFVEGRNISIIGSVTNLIVSIIFGHYTGMFGIFLGTMFTYVIQIIMKIHYMYKLRFQKSANKCFKAWGEYTLILLLLLLGSDLINKYLSISTPIIAFISYGFLGTVLSLLIIGTLYYKSDEFLYGIEILKVIISHFKGRRI